MRSPLVALSLKKLNVALNDLIVAVVERAPADLHPPREPDASALLDWLGVPWSSILDEYEDDIDEAVQHILEEAGAAWGLIDPDQQPAPKPPFPHDWEYRLY